MATLREIVTKLGFELDDKAVDESEERVKKFSINTKVMLAGVAAGVIAIGAKALQAAGDMEMLTTQFEVMLGSSEAAISMMDDLKKFAASTPFALNDLAKGTQQLLSFGVASDDVVDRMRMLGDTAGGDAEKLSGLILAFGKVQTKGKASLEEINMIAERGIPIFDVLSEQLGTTKENLFKMISAGKVSADDMTTAFRTMTSEGGMFFKGMEKQSLTFQGLISTMKDNLTLMLADIGNALLPLAKSLVGLLTELIQGPLVQLANSIMEVLTPILEVVTSIVTSLVKKLAPVFDMVSTILTDLGEVVSSVLEPLSEVLDIVLEVLGDLIVMLTGELMQILKPILNILKVLGDTIGVLLKALMPLFEVLMKVFAMNLTVRLKMMLLPLQLIAKLMEKILIPLLQVTQAITKFLSPAVKVLSILIDNALHNLMSLFNLLKWIFSFLFGKIKELGILLVTGIWNTIKNIFNGIKIGVHDILSVVSGVIDVIAGKLRVFWDWLGERFPWLTNLINGIGRVFTNVWESIGNVFKNIWDSITGAIQALIGWVNKIPGVDFKLPSFEGVSINGGGVQEFLEVTTPEKTPAFAGGVTNQGGATNVEIKMDSNITVPAGSDVTGIQKAVETTARSIFNIELKKVLVDAGY